MSIELNLSFSDEHHVTVRLDPDDSGQLGFVNPMSDGDLRDLRWYVETYGAHSLGDPDDKDAKRIASQLPVWGKALFDVAFSDRPAQRLFNAFKSSDRGIELFAYMGIGAGVTNAGFTCRDPHRRQ